MFKNYIKITWRNFLRNKTVSFIHIFGMSLGLTVFFMIGLYVLHAWSYDRFLPDSERIVRIVQNYDSGYMASTPPGLAPALEREITGVESLTLVDQPMRELLGVDNEYRYVDRLIFTDEKFTDVFQFQALQGVGAEALVQPGKIILTRSLAEELYGEENPLGKTVQFQTAWLDEILNFEVEGVIEDPPSNFHFPFKALLSKPDFAVEPDVIQWRHYGGYIYVRLQENIDLELFRQQLINFEEKTEKPDGLSAASILMVQPLTEIHLAKNGTNESARQGSRETILIFMLTGILILGIAGFNYTNLATAQGMNRMQEIGIRKASGATRKELIAQFLGESLLLALLSLPLALLLLKLFFPLVTGILSVDLSYTFTAYPQLLFSAFAITIFMGLIAGMYPAFVLSSMPPATVLKKWGESKQKGGFRKVLVSAQFAISIILLAGTLIIWQQMHYLQKMNLGFDSEQVLTFSSGELGESYQVFKNELARKTRIVSVSSGPVLGLGRKNMTTIVEDPDTGERRHLSIMDIDYDYISLMGLTLISGRDFSPERPADTENGIIINEAAIRLLELSDGLLEETVQISGEDKKIIGVVEDFYNESLYHQLAPVAFRMNPGNNWTGLIKLAPMDFSQTIMEIEETWQEFLPHHPFEFAFLDDQIEAQYRQEQQLGFLFSGFSGIAILIAGLGLFGLTIFMAATRTKEIGVRKVLGASVTSIMVLLTKDFIRLVGIGFIIAVPIVWYGMNRWLENFAYRIEIGPGVFALAGIAALAIAVLTVSWQSTKAALANPVESLRSE